MHVDPPLRERQGDATRADAELEGTPVPGDRGEEKCVQLTEDDDVFVVTGFFLADAVNCIVSTPATAVAGGEMTPERIEGAAAPWITWTPDSDQPEAVLRAMDEQGEQSPEVSEVVGI